MTTPQGWEPPAPPSGYVQQPQTYGTGPWLPPQPPPKPKRRWVKPALIAGAVLVAFGAGTANGSTEVAPVSAPVPVPTATVTETSDPVEVEKTPQACLDALDYGEDLLNQATKVIGYMEPALTAVYTLDSAKIRQITGKVETAGRKIDKIGPKYQRAKAECEEKR